MTDYRHNLRKRILIAIGAIAAYYLINLPYILINGFFDQPTLQNDLPDYFIYNVIKFGTVSAVLYIALIVVKPSLFPKSTKYKRLIILIVILIPTSVIALQSGYIISELEKDFV
jgi:cytochrome bd-type quinol oxidase subunit 1